MKKIIAANPGTATRLNAVATNDTPLPHHFKGELPMSQQQEYAIYYRLAKEIIESRLDAEPTIERVTHLANSLRAIETEIGQ